MVLMASLGKRRKFVQPIKISSYCSKVGGLVEKLILSVGRTNLGQFRACFAN